ncbi:esterase family protein [Paenibacillus sp. F411]|uniref:alpha/beta hydrolase-fold protein n=1 Tax=Paenibacillus sp. F411 TaxID=2820239 RepID=UPI001AAEA0A6|nr:alpha/beta hydrolase-fold protein [Paenibacillus sp. F411]MBO2942764.1 esterase family protein [Paenibacillus sp. F411]
MTTSSVIERLDGFKAKLLNNERRIFVYLPPGYHYDRSRRYPVLYMHAGQRAFEPASPGTEAWYIHAAADRLMEQGYIDGLIIVGIAHLRPLTHNEFYHYKAPESEAGHIGCSGLQYEDFIINDLKPYIDSHYRTLRDSSNTGLIGASAGGLSTYHIGMRRPDVFGKLIMMSPYFVKPTLHTDPEPFLEEEVLVLEKDSKPDVSMWMDIGDAEGLFLPSQVRSIVTRCMERGSRYMEDIAYLEEPEAAHQEKDWGDRVHIPLLYMFGRIGNPSSLLLHGRDQIGLDGTGSVMNGVLRYDSGFAVSVLDGQYTSSDPQVLQVGSYGELKPQKPGTSEITLSTRGLTATKMITVIPQLPNFVTIHISAQAPVEAQPAASIYGGMGMKLDYTGEGRYEGSFKVPRNAGFHFRFTRGFRRFETGKQGQVMTNRRLRADQDLKLHYTISGWDSSMNRASNEKGAEHEPSNTIF